MVNINCWKENISESIYFSNKTYKQNITPFYIYIKYIMSLSFLYFTNYNLLYVLFFSSFFMYSL